MAGFKFRLLSLLLMVVISIFNADCAKLNVPRVLLPRFDKISTNFTLDVSENGCYRWTSSRPEIVEVTPVEVDEFHQCSIKAVVSAVTKDPTRNTVIILAEEVRTGFVLRCDVIVDDIKSLSIVTTTRELYMEEAPEVFEVRAIDDQGNEFTTLEGVEFQWNIENVAQTSSTYQVLRFMTFKESPYETPLSVAKFDAIDRRGHMVLVEGIKTGAAKVSVRLINPEYKEIPKTEVVLTVVANLLLDPPDTHILVGDTVQFRLLQMQHGRLEEIKLPSTQYLLDVENSEVMTIDRSVSRVRGLRLGQTRVVLRDRHSLEDSAALKLPTALVTVTQPAYLQLHLLPYNNWALTVGDEATIQVQVFDRNNHRIHLGDAVSVRTDVSEKYFQIHNMTYNGTVLDGTAVRMGTVPVTAILDSVRVVGGTEVKIEPIISAHEDMLIYPQIAVIPNHVIVPWEPTLTRSEIKLVASGGDGNYGWRTNNLKVTAVSKSGVVRVTGFGESVIHVSMIRNPAIIASSQVEVLSPSHIEILNNFLEAPVNKPIILHIILYGDKVDEDGNLERLAFTHCDNIQFDLEISNNLFVKEANSSIQPLERACTAMAIVGSAEGTSTVKVFYKADNILLEASTEVAAFSPLDIIHPEKKIAVLAVGSSRHIVWKGGPRVWLGRPAEHIRTITSDSESVKFDEVPSNRPLDHFVYSVLCTEIGEFNLALDVKNVALNGKYKDTESISKLKVICAKPRFISLYPDIPVAASCPYSTESARAVALSSEPLKLIVKITDARGNVFDNATSLLIDWRLSSKSLGYIQYENSIVLEEKKEYNYLLPLNHYQIVYPKNTTGTLVIEGIVANYRLQKLNNLGITPESPAFWIENEQGVIVKPDIKNTLTIVLVNASMVKPDRATVFNHPKNKVTLKVTQGSGFYKFDQSAYDIAEVNYFDSSKTIEVVPKSDGVLRLTLIDLCLSYKSPTIEIQVLKVGSMRVEMVDRVERGSTITATVWLFDSIDNALQVSNTELLELRPSLESSLVSFTKIQTDTAEGQVKFNITGLELGITTVTFTSGFGEREIRSQPQQLQVFSPLRLIPQDLILPVGATFQVTSTGGPQPDCSMEYSSSENTIAKINSAAVIEAQKVGETVVSGLAVGSLKSTGGKIVYSRDTVNVRVIPLDNVKIHSPLTKLKVGCKMPVWAKGVPDKISPLVLGSIQPPLLFKWSASIPDIIDVQHVFYNTGVEVPAKDRLSMRVVALKPGRVSLHLNVSRAQRQGVLFSDHLDIEVFEALRLTNPPEYQASTLLMSPFSQLPLKTNKDSVSEITFSVSGAPELGSDEEEATAVTSHTSVVHVSSSGVVTAHSTLGAASVLIRTLEDYGLKQIQPVTIQVKKVSYIMVNINSRLHLGSNKVVSALPRGMDIDFTVSYHDNVGEVFAATRTDLRSAQNRYDVLKAIRGNKNGTLVTKLISYGPAVIKVWDESTPKLSEDYIKMRVDHLISPTKSELTVGDIVCFSMPLLSEDGDRGVWSTVDSDIIVMETGAGLARAVKPGRAVVKYSLGNYVTTATSLDVHPLQYIVFLPLESHNLTNWGSFSVPLLLLSEQDGSDKRSNLLSSDCPSHHLALQEFPFSCEIRFNSPLAPVNIYHVFDVKPSFSFDTGLYSCDFEAISEPSLNTSTMTSNVTLRAVSNSLVSDPLVIPYLPSVFLPSPQLHLTDKEPWTMFSVIGIPQVLSHLQVFPSDASYISVSEGEPSDSNTQLFQVTLRIYSVSSQPERALYLHVFSPLTKQNISVSIHVNMQGGQISAPCLAQPASSWYQQLETFTASTVISIIVIFFVIYFSGVFKGDKLSRPQSNVYATSTPTTTHIYHNGSPSPNDSRSFIYRQPFSDQEPVYGDPNMSHSPGLTRRNRR